MSLDDEPFDKLMKRCALKMPPERCALSEPRADGTKA